MYSPNRNPTELSYERDALLRQEARNKSLVRRPLAMLSTTLVILVVLVGLAAIVVGPGRAIDYMGTYLHPVVWILGVLAVMVGLLMWEGRRALDDGTTPFDRLYWHLWSTSENAERKGT